MELTSSAYIHDVDLALIWVLNEGIKDVMPGVSWEVDALQLLEKRICREMLNNDILQKMLKDMQNLKPKLHLVFCMDEMSGMPHFVRALIANRRDFARTIANCLFPHKLANIKVFFLVTGTGSLRGLIGSLPKNFCLLKALAAQEPKKVYLALMQCMVYQSMAEKYR